MESCPEGVPKTGAEKSKAVARWVSLVKPERVTQRRIKGRASSGKLRVLIGMDTFAWGMVPSRLDKGIPSRSNGSPTLNPE
jgi:hypothetical protein